MVGYYTKKGVMRLQRFFRHNQVMLGIVAVAIGLVAAAGEILFRHAIDVVQEVLTLWAPEGIELKPWHLFLMPVLGGLFVGAYIHVLMPNKKPEGVSDVINATAFNRGKMSIKTGFHAAIASAVSIGAGGSVGREGPIVHLGASIGSSIAQFFQLSQAYTRTLLGCGIAAAIATAFNAPIAGVFFAMEVVIGHYALRAFTPIVISSVVAAIMTRIKYGDYPAFALTETLSITSFMELPLFAILGLASAGAAMAMIYGVFAMQKFSKTWPCPAWIKPAIGGLFIGGIALYTPEVMGVGYDTAQGALNGLMPIGLMAILCLTKILATGFTLGSGFSGGIFSPALFVGAMLGGAFGGFLAEILGWPLSSVGTYATIGMGAVSASVMGAPITAIMIIFEMTGDYGMTIALMVAAVVSSTTTRELGVKSYYHKKLQTEGTRVIDRYTRVLRQKGIQEMLHKDAPIVSHKASYTEVMQILKSSQYHRVYVVDKDERFLGHITTSELHNAAFGAKPVIEGAEHEEEVLEILPQTLLEKKIANDLVFRDMLSLCADDHLLVAVDIAKSHADPYIPVINNSKDAKFIGIIYQYDLLHAFHDLMLRIEAEDRGETEMPSLRK